MKPYLNKILVLAILIFSIPNFSQQYGKTAEESLNDSTSITGRTIIGGYGNAFYKRDFNLKTSTINLERAVLFVGHNFGSISFFSELEIEDAKLSGGEPGGELAFEQAYLKFNLDQNNYITAGLFIPRIGILNENHLPGQFNGNERNSVETLVLPSTWRELGVGFYGSLTSLPLNYSVAILNGLNSGGFEHGNGIRNGRYEGSEAMANSLAITGSVQYYFNNFKIQTSCYYGGTVGLGPRQADSLQLESGIFGTPVFIGEADFEYQSNGIFLKALGAFVSIPKAGEINRAYANNTPKTEYGAYAEIGYDIFHNIPALDGKQLIAFVRYEKLNLNSEIPSNGIIDATLDQQHITTGFSYFPTKNVVIKADFRFANTGAQNPALIINPSPVAIPYEQNNVFLNIGMGYSF